MTKKTVSLGLVIAVLALFAFMVGLGQISGIGVGLEFPPDSQVIAR